MDSSKGSFFKHVDGAGYTRYFSRCYNFLTSLTGWRRNIARHALDDLPQGKLLDVGCGTGYLLSLAHKQGYEVAGIDASAGMLAKLKTEHPELQAKVQEATGDKLPHEDSCFDLVIASGSLVHIPEIKETAQEIIRVLKPGGILRVIDHAKPKKKKWNTPLLTLFSHLSGDIIHDYEKYFAELEMIDHKTLARGGYLQRFDFRKAQ